MKEKICNNCIHYRRHYIKYTKCYRPINQGHCVFPRSKLRRPETKGCVHYEEKEEKQEL